MKRFCVIGLGNFGLNVARTLYEDGHEVVAIDIRQERIQQVKDFVSFAVHGDAASPDFLESQGLADMNTVFVAIGEVAQHVSTLVTLLLKEMGVPRIVVKASSEEHGRILLKVGASHIVFPEKDMAVKTARFFSSANILDYLPVGKGYSITEANAPDAYVGKTLEQLNLRKRYGMTVLAIKAAGSEEVVPLPQSDQIIGEGDLLILFGRSEDLQKALEHH